MESAKRMACRLWTAFLISLVLCLVLSASCAVPGSPAETFAMIANPASQILTFVILVAALWKTVSSGRKAGEGDLAPQAKSDWKLHIPTEANRLTHYTCGLMAGQRVRLKKDLVITTPDGVPTGTVHPCGEEWVVLAGITSDPVLWFQQPDGKRCTWRDDAAAVEEWFDVNEGME